MDIVQWYAVVLAGLMVIGEASVGEVILYFPLFARVFHWF